jgi:transcriptional regulator with XRE-family HTH domain
MTELQRPWDGASAPMGSNPREPTQMDVWVGSRLRLRRLEVGWSLEQLAKAVGVSHQQARKWETGETRMVAGRIYDVGAALNVHPGYFFEGNDALTVQTSMAADLRQVSTADGIQMLMAFNRLLPEQRQAVKLVIDAMAKANFADRTLGDSMSQNVDD